MSRIVLLVMCLVSCAMPPDENGVREAPEPWLEEFPLGRTVYTQEQSELQSTLTLSHSESATDVVPSFEYGLTDALQVELELPWRQEHGRDGDDEDLERVGVGAYYSPWNDIDRLAFGIGLDIGVPRSDNSTEVEPFVVLARRFQELEAHVTLGVERQGTHSTFLYAVSLAGAGEQGRPVLEFIGEGGDLSVSPGVVWSPWTAIEIALGLPVGVSSDAEDWGVVLRLTHEQ